MDFDLERENIPTLKDILHIIVDYIIAVVYTIHSITKGHFVLIVMKNDSVFHIKYVHARPKRLRLRESVSPFFTK